MLATTPDYHLVALPASNNAGFSTDTRLSSPEGRNGKHATEHQLFIAISKLRTNAKSFYGNFQWAGGRQGKGDFGEVVKSVGSINKLECAGCNETMSNFSFLQTALPSFCPQRFCIFQNHDCAAR